MDNQTSFGLALLTTLSKYFALHYKDQERFPSLVGVNV